MNYIGLSPEQLARFSHHWFWGICVDQKQDDNLHNATFYLQQQPELRKAMEDKVEKISQRHWLIRSFYWLVNYDQYRLHYYQLQGYWSLQLYKQVKSMSIETMMKNFGPAEAGGLVVFAVASALAMKYLSPSVLSSLEWFSNKISSHIPKENIKTVSDTLDVKPSDAAATSSLCVMSSQQNVSRPTASDLSKCFTVRENMLDMLRVLAIDSRVNETVLFDALKQAYKAACLRTHPDKTGSLSNAEFVAVGNTYSQLLKLIEQDLSLKTTSSKSGLGFFGEVDEINKRLAALKKEQDQLSGDMNQMDDDIKKFAAKIKRQTEELISQQKIIDALMVRSVRLPGFLTVENAAADKADVDQDAFAVAERASSSIFL